MSNETSPVAAPLSILDVVNPTASFGSGVLAEAKQKQRDVARENLVAVAEVILAATRGELGRLESQIQDLKAQLAKLEARRDVVTTATKYADSAQDRGLFALAATVGQKQTVIQWCAQTGVVVPPATDDIWAVPKAE